MATVGALEALVMAAGAASRFGGGKLRAPWGGGALIDGALGAALAAPVRSVWLVTGADPDVARVARACAARLGAASRLREVHAAHHALGLSASLQAGIAALPRDAGGAFLFLGDMPDVPHVILPRLAAALANGALAAAPVCQGRRGHPVLIARPLFAQVASLQGDQGARAVLAGLGKQLALIETEDRGVLFDVDTPSDITG